MSYLVGKYYSQRALLSFKSKHWNLSKKIETEKDYESVFSEFDVVIVGSDQIWNSSCISIMGLFYYGINANIAKQKLIAYAPSFGKGVFVTEEENIRTLKRHLSSFHAISVREDDGIHLLRNVFNINHAVKVLDPTMLMDRKYYMSIAGIKKLQRRATLAYYLLDKTDEKINYVNEMAKRLNLTPVNMYLSDKSDNSFLSKLKSLKYPSVEYWIKCIAESQMVITDSFHGTVFSIIFNRDFLTFGNERRGNSRFISLLSMFALNDRLICGHNAPESKFPQIDYTSVNCKLNDLKIESRQFLNNALL